MTERHPYLDRDVLAVVIEADPIDERSSAADALDTEAALRYTRAKDAMRNRSHPRRCRRRLRLVATMSCVAAAGALALTIGAIRSGRVPDADAAVLSHARRALLPQSGSVLKVVSSISKDGDPSVVVRSWTEIGGSDNARMITSVAPGRAVETATRDARPELYDSATDTIYEGVPETRPTGGSPDTANWLRMLRQPHVAVDRQAMLDGRPAIKVTQTADATVNVYWMQPRTYRPLQFVSRVRDGVGETRIRYRAWQVLAPGDASTALTSLDAQHPSARLDADPSAYVSARGRLDGRRSR